MTKCHYRRECWQRYVGRVPRNIPRCGYEERGDIEKCPNWLKFEHEAQYEAAEENQS